MNKKDFAKLCLNFDKEPSEELYELWIDNLRPYDEEEIHKAISTIVANDKYFPTLNRVLEVVKEIVKNETFVKDITKYKNTEWYGKDIESEPIDEKTEETYKDFQNFINEFREN